MIRKKELRKELIESKAEKIVDNIEFIEDNLPSDFETFKNSRMLKSSIYKETEFSIELVLDICAIINIDLRLGVPKVEENILENLEKNKIFPKSITSIILEMKKFRNILVHRYGEIDDEIAFETIKDGLKDFELIIKEIERVIK